MTLPAIYISLHLVTVALLFIKSNFAEKHKKPLITSHSVLFAVVLVDIFLINLKGVWLDRILVLAFLLTASATFALYRRTLKTWQKIYFGFFLFYPIIAAATFLMDRIFFVVVASPLLASLTVPDTVFSSKDYEVREQFGVIAPRRLQLIQKGFITEKVLGSCNDEDVVYLDITSLTIQNQTKDTTKVIIISKDTMLQATFVR